MDQTLHDEKHHHHHHRRRSNKILPEYTELTAADIALLTQILSHAPRQGSSTLLESYKLIVGEQMSKLPPYLRTKIPWISSFCSLHNKINPFPVNSILEWLKEEVEHYIPQVWCSFRREKLFNEEQMKLLSVLEDLSVLWNATNQSKKSKGRASRMGLSHSHGTAKCSACILARIGGNAQALLALGAFFVGRVHSSIWKRSKRIMWVESWIRGAVDDNQEDQAIRKMWQLGMELRSMRKKAPIVDRAYVDEFVEKARAAEHDSETPLNLVRPSQPLADDHRNVADWLAQATADEVFEDEEVWQQLQPAQTSGPTSRAERNDDSAFEFEEDLEASQLFRASSSIYSQRSEWSQPSSHDTESELIGLYQHSTLTLVEAGKGGLFDEPAGEFRRKEKQSELAKYPRHPLSLVTKPRRNFV